MNRGSNADPVFQRELGREYPTIDRGEGIHLYDTAGKRYIDGAGGVFVTNLGHGNQQVIEALGMSFEDPAIEENIEKAWGAVKV